MNTVQIDLTFIEGKQGPARRAFQDFAVSLIEACAQVCDRFAASAVGNGTGGRRDPYVYEQGVGAERCAADIRALKGYVAGEPCECYKAAPTYPAYRDNPHLPECPNYRPPAERSEAQAKVPPTPGTGER